MDVSLNTYHDEVCNSTSDNYSIQNYVNQSLPEKIPSNSLENIFQEILFAVFYLKKPAILPTLNGNIRFQIQTNQDHYLKFSELFPHCQNQK